MFSNPTEIGKNLFKFGEVEEEVERRLVETKFCQAIKSCAVSKVHSNRKDAIGRILANEYNQKYMDDIQKKTKTSLNLYKARSCTEKFIKANQLWESKTGA
jgi:hypothetical protein